MTEPNAVAFLNCMKDSQPKPVDPNDNTTGGALLWDLKRACEPLRIFSIVECKANQDRVEKETGAKNQV